MGKKLSKTQEAMRKLGSIGGRANVKKHGRDHMRKISRDYHRRTREAQGVTTLPSPPNKNV